MSVVDLCHPGGVLGTGNSNGDVMFIGIAPGRDEWMRTKQPFTGPSGKLLDGLLTNIAGINRDSVYLTNLLCWWKDSPTHEDIEKCLPRLIQEVKTVKPKLIYLLGKIVTEFVLPEYTFGKARSGAFWHKGFNCWVISTNHPSAYFDRGGQYAEIHDGVRDIRKIPIYTTASKDFGNYDYSVMESLDDCNHMLFHMADHEDEVAVDVETYYDKSGMLSIAFGCEHGTFHIPREFIYGPDYKILADSDAIWTFHNGQFDSQQIKKWLGVLLPIREDTLLMSYTLDERAGSDTELEAGGDEHAVGIHGLKKLAREYCGAEFYSENIGKKDDPIDQLSPDRLANYNSGDAAYTYRLVKYFKPLQIADNVREVYETLLIPAANTFRDMNERGCYVDKKAIKELALEWIPRWIDKEKELLTEAHRLGWKNEEINTASPKQLSEFIYDILLAPKIGVGKMERSTAKPIVEKMVADYPEHPASVWLNGLLEWRGLERDINTYIKSVEELKDKKSFIHPEGLLHGTRNGRTAWHNPPIQTIPKARTVGIDRARIRRIFAAAPPSDKGTGERLLMEADFRQAELWVSYFVTGDEQMHEDLESGDFHARVAEANWGITKENARDDTHWNYARDSSKRIVYGITYGAGPDTLAEGKKLTGASGANYMFMETTEQAKAAIDGYLARYHVFHAWREAEKQIVSNEGEQVSRTGRKRRYYMIQSYRTLNQAINTPISSFSHDFVLASIIELHPLLSEFDAYINYEVHDSIVFDFPKQYINEVAQLVERVMTKPRWGSFCGIPVDIKCGPNWFDQKDLDKVLKEMEMAA